MDWITLPEHLWIKILQQLDVKNLLKATEVCTTFNNLLVNPILNDKVKLVLNYRLHEQLWDFLKHCLIRNYTNVELKFLSESTSRFSEVFDATIELLKPLHFKVIQIYRCDIKNSMIRLLTILKYSESLRKFSLTNHEPRALTETTKTIPYVNMISFHLNNNNSVMDIFDKISIPRLTLSNYEEFNEKLLMNHDELQGLQEDRNGMFVYNQFTNNQFSLHYLNLYFAKWHNRQNALNFIKNQTDLRRVHLWIRVNQYDILFLKHIIEKNPKLEELLIKLDEGCEELLQKDIHQIRSNPSVTHFYIQSSSNRDPTLIEKMFKLFPNNGAINDPTLFHDEKSDVMSYFIAKWALIDDYDLLCSY